MQGCHILLLILLAAAIVACGCTEPEESSEAQPASPAPAPSPAQPQALGGGGTAPTPAAPARGEKTPQSIGFVDPGTYRIPTPTPTIAMTAQPNDLRVAEGMIEYATATSDNPPGVLATETYYIPFPYWAFNVSATPANDHPWLAIEVRDKADPNRVVIDDIRYSQNDFPYSGGKFGEKKERFVVLEGYRDYYFIARSGSLTSLEISVLVPEKYLV